jgi:hypothetical protein
VNHEEFVPAITATNSEYLIRFNPAILPKGACDLDSLSAFNGSKTVPVDQFIVDGTPLNQVQDILRFFDGMPHVVELKLKPILDDNLNATNTTITHVEIQANQSKQSTRFEFPKLSQSSIETVINRTDPFQVVMSPVIPNVANGDIIVDLTYRKVFQITSSNWWNDKRRLVLGWECDVRPCQPQELYTLLPKRRFAQSQHVKNRVIPNSNLAV